MRLINNIRRNYITPKNAASFSGISKQYRKYKKQAPLGIIRKSLQGVSSYSLHRERKKPRKRNPFFILKKRQQVQIDLLDISALSEFNNGTKFLFCGIDMFSKLAFIAPMRDKTAKSAKQAILQMLQLFGERPREILSDRGTEFKNQTIKELMQEKNITHRFTNSEVKCGGVERFNKTIQGKIYKHLTQSKTRKYINILPELLDSYNNTYHSTIKITPFQAEEERFGEFVRGQLYSFYSRGSKFQQNRKFSIGDHVRISRAKSNFQRSYGQIQKHEIFEIVSFNTHLPIPMYFIKSLYDGEEIIGGFYDSELVKVDCLRMKVLKRKDSSILVQWSEDPLKPTSWIDESKENLRCSD